MKNKVQAMLFFTSFALLSSTVQAEMIGQGELEVLPVSSGIADTFDFLPQQLAKLGESHAFWTSFLGCLMVFFSLFILLRKRKRKKTVVAVLFLLLLPSPILVQAVSSVSNVTVKVVGSITLAEIEKIDFGKMRVDTEDYEITLKNQAPLKVHLQNWSTKVSNFSLNVSVDDICDSKGKKIGESTFLVNGSDAKLKAVGATDKDMKITRTKDLHLRVGGKEKEEVLRGTMGKTTDYHMIWDKGMVKLHIPLETKSEMKQGLYTFTTRWELVELVD